MMYRVTHGDAMSAISTLATAYSKKLNDREASDLAGVWVSAMEGVTPKELKEAVRRYVKTGDRYFPRPAAIRAQAVEIRAEWNLLDRTEVASDTSESFGPCRVCGARLRLLQPEEMTYGGFYNPPLRERYGILHDSVAHERARAQIVGYFK